MFVNLKSKIGDVADLKKLTSPQSLTSVSGSRQRSSQHTPGSLTPRSRHSRQASTASLQAIGLPISPPQSPTDNERAINSNDRVQDLEREISKLRTALETQQDASLERLNAREQEWRGKLQEERDKLNTMAGDLEAARNRERELQQMVDSLNSNKKHSENQLKQAEARVKGLEARVCEMQDNCDQMEGLNAQEMAKIKHMLLNTNGELEQVKKELGKKSEALASAEARLSWAAGLEERIGFLSEEKTELETQVAGLNKKLNAANARCISLEEAKSEEIQHLQNRIVTLEQRHSQTALQETDKVQALIKERENMEHCMEEARQQLNNIKASWSDKIMALENQIHHLNAKIAEDQSDLQESEEKIELLRSDISSLKEENTSLKLEKTAMENKLQGDISQLNEDLETLHWQLGNTTSEKDEQLKFLQEKLTAEKEKLQSCSSVLQSKLESLASLEKSCLELESEVTVVKGNLMTTQDNLVLAQNEKKSLQETLQQERTTMDALERGKLEIHSKLDIVNGEKTRLSQNLDEYVDKVNTLEVNIKVLEEEIEKKAARVTEMEAKLDGIECENETLKEQLRNSEKDFVHKIEESDLVKGLRESVKTLEDELVEKKQALKVQGQRLADMKKTIQRELKLTADSPDSTVDPRFDSRPRDSSPASNGPAATNGGDNGIIVNHAYLKHVIIKYLTSREYEAVHLTRAVATLLHMTSEEERLLRETLEWKMSWFGSKPNLGKGQEALTIPPSQ